ncbi:MAG TPA: DUF488 domain-containing protein [Bryobacteraceae bacterium]|nr:DUF488 domain-containing protein [Bryobacteraceae bacterium]
MPGNHASMWTIGHSNHSLAKFLEILQAHHVDALVDVRKMPRSRRNPHFNRETLPGPLASEGIAYLHMPGLGGLRRPRRDSTNTAWRNLSFRGYADYMQTPEFQSQLDELLAVEGERVTIMCAEALPAHCHRSLIADALTARGVAVSHILSARRVEPHQMTSFAQVDGKRVTYPATNLTLFSAEQN